MAYTTYTGNTDYIATLDDQPNDVGGLSAAQLKAKFDQFGTEFIAWFNATHLAEIDAHLASNTINAPTLTNSWVNVDDAIYNAAGYWKDNHGYVHVRGRISSGASGTTAFTLPSGYRPSKTTAFTCALSSVKAGLATITSSGSVVVYFPDTITYADLGEIVFKGA